MKEKPILFNTEMVRAILDGRKTQTRRIMKRQPPEGEKVEYNKYYNMLLIHNVPAWHGPFEVGDMLWVRETWKSATGDPAGGGYALFDTYVYKADGKSKDDYPVDELMLEDRWHPSIHMPRKAARIFLRVKDVRAEKLQSITREDVKKEGVKPALVRNNDLPFTRENTLNASRVLEFIGLWNSTIKPKDRSLYGWNADPWVWVVEFERIKDGGDRDDT